MLPDLRVRLFEAGLATLRSGGWRHSIHSSFWRLYLNSGDGAEVQMSARRHRLRAGRIYLIPRDVRFETRCQQTLDHLYIHFDVLGWGSLALIDAFDGLVTVPDASDLAGRARRLAGALRAGGALQPAIEMEIHSIVLGSLSRRFCSLPDDVAGRATRRSHALGSVLPALRLIEHDSAQPLSNGALAEACHLSDDYFARRFREAVGKTPRRYLLEQRTRRAAQMLLFSDRTLDQIALDTGFPNRSYLTRVFTHITGQPPARYRREPRVGATANAGRNE